jgi:ubiquinone/menaquinone biosynthesis C-methylase UbiE
MLMALAAANLVVIATTGVRSQTPEPRADPRINEPFRKPRVKDYIKKFEAEDRENYAHRHEIVKALRLKPGMVVADVGAGTGLFTRLIAEKVGPAGRVFAVDIAKEFLDHIMADARSHRQTQVAAVLGSQDSINLPPESVDLVFLSDVYHHLEKPRSVLASIWQALRPGGGLVVIEFDRVEGKSSAFVLKHVRASKDVFRAEIEAAGFVVIPSSDAPRLKENFFLRFEKSAATAARRGI